MAETRVEVLAADRAGTAAPLPRGFRSGKPRQPRTARKTRARKRPYSRYLLIAGLVGGGAYYLGWHSPVTVVRDVQVSAPKGIPAKDVLAAAGIDAGSHVPGVSPSGVRTAVMTDLPQVADVEVRRRLPHTVELVVSARQPYVALRAKGGYLIMDKEGVAFQRAKKPGNLPVIDAEKDPGRTTAITVMSQLPEALRKKVAEVKASTTDDVTLKLVNGAEVRWGAITDPDLKAQVLAALLQVKAAHYDVSAPLLPTTTEPTVTPSASATAG